MKFDDLDERMRVFETVHDVCVLPGLYIVKEGVNPKTGETSVAERARLRVIEDLPLGDDYAALIRSIPMV